MKYFFTAILILFFNTHSFSQLIGWSFDQVVRLKGSNYEMIKTKTDAGVDIYFLKYKLQNYINGSEDAYGIRESFGFKKSDNKVYNYFFVGAKKENEITEMIENNNKKFKIIDKGKDQKDFEWADEANNIVYTLSIMTDVGNGYKLVNYIAMNKE